jgi:hypothetical protein
LKLLLKSKYKRNNSNYTKCLDKNKTTWLLFYQAVWHKVGVFKFKLCLNAENDTRLPLARSGISEAGSAHRQVCIKEIPEDFSSDISFTDSRVNKMEKT